jgi:hypothetical protein
VNGTPVVLGAKAVILSARRLSTVGTVTRISRLIQEGRRNRFYDHLVGNMGFLHHIKKNIGCGIASDKGCVEELEMPAFRQTAGAPPIFLETDEGRHLRYFGQDSVKLFSRSRTEDIDVDGEPADHRDMEQQTGAALEDELQVTLRKMPQECKSMECPLQECWVDTAQLPPFFLEPVSRKTNFIDHIFNPLFPLFPQMWS